MQQVLFVICCFVALGSAFRNESASLQCGPNEVAGCVQVCPPEKTCRNRLLQIRCVNDPSPCTKKCVCAKGYYRNSIGECITEAQCDQCSKPNEFYSCNSACDNVCEDIDTQNRTNCPIQNIVCNKWCYCDDGYARDAQQNCIPVSDCPPKRPARSVPACDDPNEEFTCKKSCPPETCISMRARYKCDSKEVCTQRCACKSGYLRQEKGSPCIPTSQCT